MHDTYVQLQCSTVILYNIHLLQVQTSSICILTCITCNCRIVYTPALSFTEYMHNPTVHIDELKVTFAQSSTLLSAQPSPPNSHPSWAQTTTSTTPSMTTPWKTLNYCWSGQNKKPLPNYSTSAEVVAVHKRTLWYIRRYECWLRSVVISQSCCDGPYLCNMHHMLPNVL